MKLNGLTLMVILMMALPIFSQNENIPEASIQWDSTISISAKKKKRMPTSEHPPAQDIILNFYNFILKPTVVPNPVPPPNSTFNPHFSLQYHRPPT